MAKQQLPHVPDCLCAEFIEKTGEPCPSKSRSPKNRLIIAFCAMTFCLCLMLFPRNADGGKAAEEPSVSADFPSTDPAVTLGRPGWYYGGVQPCLRYNGKLYYWQGNHYRIAVGRTDVTPWLRQLPEGAQVIGNLSFIGEDSMPQKDLETNQLSDAYSYALDGREVLAVPGDSSTIYVYCHRYWAEGDYPAWLACPLWALP